MQDHGCYARRIAYYAPAVFRWSPFLKFVIFHHGIFLSQSRYDDRRQTLRVMPPHVLFARRCLCIDEINACCWLLNAVITNKVVIVRSFIFTLCSLVIHFPVLCFLFGRPEPERPLNARTLSQRRHHSGRRAADRVTGAWPVSMLVQHLTSAAATFPPMSLPPKCLQQLVSDGPASRCSHSEAAAAAAACSRLSAVYKTESSTGRRQYICLPD